MKNKHILILITVSNLFFSQLYAQYTISGKVIDSKTNEELRGSNIGIPGTFYQSQSDENGHFLIKNLKQGIYPIKISYLGYRDTTLSIKADTTTYFVIALNPINFLSQEIIVNATRANKYTAGSNNKITKAEIAQNNLGQDMPFLLNLMPSVVISSDAGAGVGYSGINIRGSDATRINVTINGIPINDAESHSMYWVDMPDFASSVENIQVQRGVGTSTNGSAAFGASINVQTQNLSDKSYAEVNNSYGSFNTHKHTLKFGTGLLAKHFIFDGRLSSVNSDGYIDRAKSDLKSFYFSGGYFGKNTTLKFITFSGKEKTYQAWNGVPEDSLATHRTLNEFTYSNQTDNYQQDNYQLLFSQSISSALDLNFALHYTRGKGYYEEYKEDAYYSDYGIPSTIIGTDTIDTSNLIRQKWLDNHFYGLTFSLNYLPLNKLSFVLGGAANNYEGKHFGEIIWAEQSQNIPKNYQYYLNNATKTDANVYLKANLKAGKKISLFADIQARNIYYQFEGFNDSLMAATQNVSYFFFNPKAGITFDLSLVSYLYASYSIGHREPTRSDFVSSTPWSRPKPEKMQDVEIGYKRNGKKWSISVNGYTMLYKNQLILTGKINDVGGYTRQNVDKSYRVGLELQTGIKLVKHLSLQCNLSLSQNKILNYVEYIDRYIDNNYDGQMITQFKKTDIAYSPNVISGGALVYTPININKHTLSITITEKYVGKQFLDNTTNYARSLNAFFTNDFRLNYTWRTRLVKEINITFSVNNFFDIKYEPNGYTFSYVADGSLYTSNYFFPQAGRNFIAGLGLKL